MSVMQPVVAKFDGFTHFIQYLAARVWPNQKRHSLLDIDGPMTHGTPNNDFSERGLRHGASRKGVFDKT